MERQAYVTTDNRRAKAAQWLDRCAAVKGHRPFPVDTDHAALLVLDMQTMFLRADSHAFVPSSRAIVPVIDALSHVTRARGNPVIFTRQVNRPDPAEMMNRWWGDPMGADHPDIALSDTLDTTGAEVMDKSQYSAFVDTNLEDKLRQQHCRQVIVTGVMTHLCCESTARDAFMRGFEVLFVVDATVSYTEDLHVGSLRSIAHGFGLCLAAEELLDD